VFGLAVSSDGRAIASASSDGSIIVWSPKARPAAAPAPKATPRLQAARP